MKHAGLVSLALLLAAWAAACGDDENKLPPDGKCTIDGQCPEGQKCRTSDGACLANPECTDDAACFAKDPRKVCDTAAFTCVFKPPFADECDASRPCAFGQFCSALLGKCVDAATSRDCTRRGQCPTGQICDHASNKCIQNPGCYGDAFCEEGEVCDLVNHTCNALSIECTRCTGGTTCEGGALCFTDTNECLAGNATPACRTGEKCDPLGRCVQCTNNDQCGPGTFCNTALGRCDSNVQCADDESLCPMSPNVQCVICQTPQVCDPRTKRCQAPPMECENDVDCPNGQRCDKTLDPPICVMRIPDCLPDLLDEPRNDTQATAHTLDATRTLFDELKLCPGDTDWYRIDVAAGTYLIIDARFRQSDGDIDLQLFLPDGRTLLDQSRSTTDNERVELDAGTDLTVFLRVFLATPVTNQIPYRLIVTRDAGSACMDDANEPDDTVAMAKALVSDRPYEGRLCPADPDWFVVSNVTPGTTMTATLDFRDSLGDLDLELLRAGSPVPILRSAGFSDRESITYAASFAGDYYFRVVGKGADTNVYSLRVNLREDPAMMCQDDRFEPNASPMMATVAPDMTGNVASDLSICAGDEDWFVVNLGPNELLTAEVSFAPGQDVELSLYEPGAVRGEDAPLRSSRGNNPREFVAYAPRTAGDYLLRVYGTSQSVVTPYELRIDRKPPFICAPDMPEMEGRGETMADPISLGDAPTRMDDLTLCLRGDGTFDEDWFSVALPAPAVSVIRLQYPGETSNLDFALLDETGQQLLASGGTGVDAKEIAVNVTGFGMVMAFLRVFSSGGNEAPYSISIDTIPQFDCRGDLAEPNDLRAMASMVLSSTITPIALSNLTLCATTPSPFTGVGDEDWFLLNPPRMGSRITASLMHQQGDLFMELYSPGGFVRACRNSGMDRCYSDRLGLSEDIAFTATVAAPYYLRVGSIYADPGIQVVPANAQTRYNLRLEYR